MARKIARLSSSLDGLLRSYGFGSKLHEYRVFGKWNNAVGEAIARHAQPLAMHGTKLALVVDSPAWMQQLSLMKPQIIEKVNQMLGREAIKDITLKLGDVQLPQKKEPAYRPAPVRLDPETLQQIDGYVKDLDDEETRAALRRLIEKDFQQKKRTS
jgi:predicted nucleic acid-binding Zn ribbon protein